MPAPGIAAVAAAVAANFGDGLNLLVKSLTSSFSSVLVPVAELIMSERSKYSSPKTYAGKTVSVGSIVQRLRELTCKHRKLERPS